MSHSASTAHWCDSSHSVTMLRVYNTHLDHHTSDTKHQTSHKSAESTRQQSARALPAGLLLSRAVGSLAGFQKTTAGCPLRRMLLPAVCLLLAGWRLLAAWRLQLEEPEQRAQLARLGCSGSSLGDTLHLGCGRRCAAALAFPMLRPEAGIAAAAAMAALPDVLPDHAVSRRATQPVVGTKSRRRCDDQSRT